MNLEWNKVGSDWSLIQRYVSQLAIFSLSAFLTVAFYTAKRMHIATSDLDLFYKNGKTFLIIMFFTFWIPIIPAKLMRTKFKVERMVCFSIFSLYLGYEVIWRGFMMSGRY